MKKCYNCIYVNMLICALEVWRSQQVIKASNMRRLREREIDKLSISGQMTAVFAAKQG